MLSRITSGLFIFLANLVLLGHAVIPHHHHHEEEFNLVVNSHHSGKDHEHSAPGHTHDRTGFPGEEVYILDQEIVLRLQQNRQGDGDPEFRYNYSPVSEITGTLDNYESIGFIPVLVSDASIPLIAGSYTSFIISSLGLRAPPLV